MGSLGGLEIIVIAVVALLVFGPKRLPEVSRQVGGALRELRRVQTQVKSEIDDVLRVDDTPAKTPRAQLESKPVVHPGRPDTDTDTDTDRNTGDSGASGDTGTTATEGPELTTNDPAPDTGPAPDAGPAGSAGLDGTTDAVDPPASDPD